eukprot:5858561-Amphidinium_carterae.1
MAGQPWTARRASKSNQLLLHAVQVQPRTAWTTLAAEKRGPDGLCTQRDEMTRSLDLVGGMVAIVCTRLPIERGAPPHIAATLARRHALCCSVAIR